jgi:hypothetical protein
VAEAWNFYLADYPDRRFVSALMNIISFGANIGYSGPGIVRPSRNLLSALENVEFMDAAVSSLCEKSQVHGPFASPPLASFRCSPLGSVTRKRNPDKRRLINHLSWPRGLSVNDGIPDSEASISYDMFECAVEDLIRSGPGSLMAKLDLKEAFRHIPIRPEDWHHMGFSWRRKFYYCIVLTFGLRSAPYIFNLFSEALHWIIQRHIPARLRHYLDDFFLLFAPHSNSRVAHHAVEWVMGLGRNLGLCFQDSKTEWPTTTIEFLGLELDSISMEACLPADKLTYLKELLSLWSAKRSASLREVQELSGFLQFASQVIPRSRPFIRRIIDFSMKFNGPFQRLHIPSSARADLRWWTIFSSPWNGIRVLTDQRDAIDVYTDASGSKGLGGYSDRSWFSARVPRRFRARDIQFKEIAAILHAILCWGDAWHGRHVNLHCDNQAVVAWLSSGTCRSIPSMRFVRLIPMMAAALNFTFSIHWIPTSENVFADAASRFQYSRLFQLDPTLEKTSSSTKSRIIGIKRTLTSLVEPPSTSGTASLPAHVKLTDQVSAPSSILSHLIPPFNPNPASSSLPLLLPSPNGSPTSPTVVSSTPRLKATSRAFVPSTLTQASHPPPATRPLCSASTVGSRLSMARRATPSSLSPSRFSRA